MGAELPPLSPPTLAGQACPLCAGMATAGQGLIESGRNSAHDISSVETSHRSICRDYLEQPLAALHGWDARFFPKLEVKCASRNGVRARLSAS